MRKLGDDYVAHEFRLHKKVTSEAHLNRFYTAWNDYLTMLLSKGKLGKSLDSSLKDKMNEEQLEKLQQLKEESKFHEASGTNTNKG